MVAGTISLGLGGLGVFLPILPTTPFLLLSAACYSMSSERMHHWMLSNRLFGSYIKNYQEGRGLPLRTKILTIPIMDSLELFGSFYGEYLHCSDNLIHSCYWRKYTYY